MKLYALYEVVQNCVGTLENFITANLGRYTTAKQHDHISFYLIYVKGYLFKVTFSP